MSATGSASIWMDSGRDGCHGAMFETACTRMVSNFITSFAKLYICETTSFP